VAREGVEADDDWLMSIAAGSPPALSTRSVVAGLGHEQESPPGLDPLHGALWRPFEVTSTVAPLPVEEDILLLDVVAHYENPDGIAQRYGTLGEPKRPPARDCFGAEPRGRRQRRKTRCG
jgi:hypothetical protein